jgi:hypothetical protein
MPATFRLGNFFCQCGTDASKIDEGEVDYSESDDDEHGFMTARSHGRTSTYAFASLCCAAGDESPEPTRPDFCGYWQLARVEGNWDAFLQELGYNYFLRKTMGALGFGAGVLYEEIKIDGTALWLKTTSPISTNVIDVDIDGTEQETIDPDDVPIWLTLWWDGDSILADSRYKATGKPMAHIARSFEDGCMKVVFTSPSKQQVVRYFVRQ